MPRKKPNTLSAPKPGKVFGRNGVFYRMPKGPEGPLEIKIDFGQIPSPSGYFYADCLRFDTDSAMRMATLSFGLRGEQSEKLSERIEIVFPFNALLGFWQSAIPIEETVDKLLQSYGSASEPAIIARGATDPKTPVAVLFANILFMAAGDGETSLDFYHLSPREAHLAKTQRADMKLQATIRVIISTILTRQFLSLVKSFAERSAPGNPSQERNHSVAGIRR